MALPAPDRRRNARTGAYWPALRAFPNPAPGRNHVTLRNVRRPGPSCSSPAFLRLFEAVAEPANRGDDVRPELFANSCDEDLDRVGIAVEVLIVDMLDQFGAAHDLALMVHQIRQQLVFLRRELHGLAVLGDLSRTRIEADVAGCDLGRGHARGTTDQRAQTRDQLFCLEGFGEIIVGPGIKPGDLVGPAVPGGHDK